MKLSEAIRQGAALRPQATGQYFGRLGGEWYSCALGAAAEAISAEKGPLQGWHIDKLLAQHFPQVIDSKGVYTDLGLYIAELNDTGMTREDIADYLESEGM